MQTLEIKTTVRGYLEGQTSTFICKTKKNVENARDGMGIVFSAAMVDVRDLETEMDEVTSTSVMVTNEEGFVVALIEFGLGSNMQGRDAQVQMSSVSQPIEDYRPITPTVEVKIEKTEDPLLVKPDVPVENFELPTYVSPDAPTQQIEKVASVEEAPVKSSNPILDYVNGISNQPVDPNKPVKFNHEEAVGIDGSGGNAKRMLTTASAAMLELHYNRGDVIRFETNHKSPQYEDLRPFNRDEIERCYYLVSQPKMIGENYLVDGDGESRELTPDQYEGFVHYCETWKVEK